MGYVVAIIGVVIGAMIQASGSDPNRPSTLLIAYMLWSTYWGYRIVGQHLSGLSDPSVHLSTQNIVDYYQQNLLLRGSKTIIKLILAYLVGVCGGALYKQVRLSLIAYR